MKKALLLSITFLLIFSGFSHPDNYLDESFKNGDIIFQSSMSGQSYAVQLATKSKYSHVGVLFKEGEQWYVYEAVQPVKKTKFEKWIKNGDKKAWITKRYDSLSVTEASKIKLYLTRQLKKDYDIYFNWGDSQLYCSELVWKAYHSAGIDLCALREMRSFDLTHPIVKAKLQQRYGNNIPLDEKVVAPSDIFDSSILVKGSSVGF